MSPQEKAWLQLALVTEEAMQSALSVQSTFPDMLRSATAGHLPNSILELCHTQITVYHMTRDTETYITMTKQKYRNKILDKIHVLYNDI